MRDTRSRERDLDKTLTVVSPPGIRAVRERIDFVSEQVVKATDEGSAEEAIRIYRAVKLMLNEMLEAGPRGISLRVLRSKATVYAGLSDAEADQAMVIIKGHMARVREVLNEQNAADPLEQPAQRYSPLREQHERRPLKGRGSR